LSRATSDPAASIEDKQAAARKFADTTLMEQQRVGVPAEQRQILPSYYVDTVNKQIATAADSEDPQKRIGLIARVQQEAALWGDDNWPSSCARWRRPRSRSCARSRLRRIPPP